MSYSILEALKELNEVQNSSQKNHKKSATRKFGLKANNLNESISDTLEECGSVEEWREIQKELNDFLRSDLIHRKKDPNISFEEYCDELNITEEDLKYHEDLCDWAYEDYTNLNEGLKELTGKNLKEKRYFKSEDIKNNLEEAAARVKRLPITATGIPSDYLCRDLMDGGWEEDPVKQYYTDNEVPEADLQIKEIYLSKGFCEDATSEDYLDPDWWEDIPFGMKLVNGDYVFTDPDTQSYPLYIRCQNLNELKDYILGNIDY